MAKTRGRGRYANAAQTQRLHLTDKRIGTLEVPKKTVSIYDEKSSLGLRLTAKGKRTFFWNHSVRGTPVWRGIGEWPTISLSVARDKAAEYDGLLAIWKKEGFKGPNPFLLPDDTGILTVEKLAELYVERHLLLHAKDPQKAARDVRATLRRYLADWRQKELGEITRAAVLARHTRLGKGVGLTRKRRRLSESGRATANHTMDFLRTIYKWAIDNELWSGSNPAKLRSKERFPEPARSRCLSPEELTRLLAVIEDKRTHPDLRDFVSLSLATAQRKKTVMHARWDAINFRNQTWTLEASETKNRKPLTVELTPAALRVLRERHANKKPDALWVFPGTEKARPRFDFNQGTWRALLKRAELDYPRSSPLNFRGHDLRHTAVSYMVMAGRSLEQVGATIGHASAKSTQRYAHLAQRVQRETAIAGEEQMRKMIEAARQNEGGAVKLLEASHE
jgi:integrase